MKTNKFAISAAAAVLGFVSGFGSSDAQAHSPEVKDKEKCFGIAKAGKNDCGWSGGSCAGSATKDAEAGAWVFVAKGTCEKIVGGSLEAKAVKK